jgi:hypothetical protein
MEDEMAEETSSPHISDTADDAARKESVRLAIACGDMLVEQNISGNLRGLKMMDERAARADVSVSLVILDKVPDVPPDAGDELSEDDSPTGSQMR